MASLAPGETWVGNRISDYASTIEQPDPDHARIQNANWDGRDCLAYWLYNDDLGPDSTPPSDDPNPRSQAESSTFMRRDGHYIIDHYMWMKRENFPTWSTDGWFNLWEKYGKPFGGPPPLAWGTHDGVHWEFRRGEDPWNVNYQEPIFWNSWEQITFDFVNSESGKLVVSRNGVPVFEDSAYPCINNSDRDGNWMTVPHLYMERDNVVPNGHRIGPVWMYDVVRQIS